jgi:hypothetical protein
MLSAVIDDGHAIHYAAVPRGTPVYAADGTQVGKVHQIVDNYREHILDGVVIERPDGERVFADGPEVERTAERGVTLNIHTDKVDRLPPPERGAGTFSANRASGRLSKLFGRAWKRD